MRVYVQPTACASWTLSADVEDLAWNPHHPEQFMVAQEDGYVNAYDARVQNRVLYSIQAHTSACRFVEFKCIHIHHIHMHARAPGWCGGDGVD